MLDDGALEKARMHRADTGIDVHAVRFAANRDHLCAQLVKHGRSDVIRGAMRAIDDELQTLEIELVRVRALAELDVAAGGIVDAERLAQLLRGYAGDRLTHAALDRLLDRAGELGTGGGKELDAVIFEWIVRGADHDAGGQAQRAREIRDRGCGQRPGEIDVDAGRRQTRFERGFEQIAGDARVLADQYGRCFARPPCRFRGEHAAGGVAELEHELGGDRRLAHAPAHAIGAEVAFKWGQRRLFVDGLHSSIGIVQKVVSDPTYLPARTRP